MSYINEQNRIVSFFMWDMFDDHTKGRMTDMFKNVYPGNYEIKLTLTTQNYVEWELIFEDEAEELIFILKHG